MNPSYTPAVGATEGAPRQGSVRIPHNSRQGESSRQTQISVRRVVVGSYRTLSFFVILGPARHRKTPNENFTIAHVPVCQLKTLVTYMNSLWLLEQGEIKKLPKTGEKPWFLKFLELKSNHRFRRLNGNVVVNIQANIVVLCVHIALHAKIRF